MLFRSRRWGGVPLARETVAGKYTGARGPAVESFVVEEAGRPVGYIQSWRGEERRGGIDVVLVPEARGRGLGPEAVRALVRHLLEEEGWRQVTVDPAVGNERAIRAFEKAGFRAERELPDHPDGPALLMSIERKST